MFKKKNDSIKQNVDLEEMARPELVTLCKDLIANKVAKEKIESLAVDDGIRKYVIGILTKEEIANFDRINYRDTAISRSLEDLTNQRSEVMKERHDYFIEVAQRRMPGVSMMNRNISIDRETGELMIKMLPKEVKVRAELNSQNLPRPKEEK